MKRLSRLSAVVATTAAVVAVAVPAWAAWSIHATSPAVTAYASALNPVQAPTAAATSSSAITVSWVAPLTGGAPQDGYTVRRLTPTTKTVCTKTTSLSCQDTGLTASTPYTYSIVSALGTNWESTAQPANATTLAAVVNQTFSVSVSGAATAGTAKTVTLTAMLSGVAETSLTYPNGAHTVVFSGAANSPNGTAPTYPATVTFTNGVGTANLTFAKAETFTLTATEGVRTGSTSVTVNRANVQLTITGTKCGTSDTKGSTESLTLGRPAADSFGNSTTASSVTAAVGATLASPATTSQNVTIAAAATSQAFSVDLSNANNSTTVVSTDAPTGYTAASTCSITHT